MAGLALLLAACEGGGSGSHGANNPGANQAPTVTVQFPLSGSLTTGTSITVRGTAIDPDGDVITSVTVHGMLAETDDGFATWQVPNVPLQAGTQSLEGVVQDAEGGVGRFSLALERGENPGPELLWTPTLGVTVHSTAFYLPTFSRDKLAPHLFD